MMNTPHSRRFALLVALTLALPLARFDGHAQTTAASKTKAHVVALASERLEGRLTGSPGERLAADYLIAELERIGAKPVPGQADYRLPFEFTAGMRDGGSLITVGSGSRTTFQARSDVQALSFSDNGEVSGPVAFR